MEGYLVYCVFVCHFFILFCFLFLCTVADFSAAGKARGVKFCMRVTVGLLSRQVFSPFGEHWLAGSHGSGGISRRPGVVSADHAGRHLWLRDGVGSVDRVVVIYGYDGRRALGIAGGGVA